MRTEIDKESLTAACAAYTAQSSSYSGYTIAVSAAISAYLSSLEAKGMVVVPSEPTEAMIQAGQDVEPLHSTSADFYRAMIAASRTSQEAQNERA